MSLAGVLVLAAPDAASAPAVASVPAAVANTHPAWARTTADLGAAAVTTILTPTVFYAGQNPTGMTAYAEAVSTPASPLYHHFLTPAEVQARFGATAAQVRAVRSWLAGAGLRITSSNSAGVTVKSLVNSRFMILLVMWPSVCRPGVGVSSRAATAVDLGDVEQDPDAGTLLCARHVSHRLHQ